jgi:hypothetical protein
MQLFAPIPTAPMALAVLMIRALVGTRVVARRGSDAAA